MELEWDENGYPTDASLDAFANFDGAVGFTKWGPFVANLPSIMEGCPYSFVTSEWVEPHNDGNKELLVSYHTRGWSGAEEIIDKILENTAINALYYAKWERGGHYYFLVPADQTGQRPPQDLPK